ncbi:hypothetical protein F5Y17DRAFT_415283 [Xylariaceae sp. FL0594]|nr:hypothetical protein F5Y17DRAFT_415283 [Xylariaceae sp. FL0594]
MTMSITNTFPSSTFLKRKGGLFKKAHELSVLCSVDVAVFIFGNNKKLYEYSSRDMRELIQRYSYHGGPNEHKGPNDFGGDDDDDDEMEGTPPHVHEGSVEPPMIPPHFSGQQAYAHLRHHTPSASPPINGMPFAPRSHTPQPPMSNVHSRPSSRADVLRPPTGPPPGPAPGLQGVPNGYAYIPQPGMYAAPAQPALQHAVPPPPAPYQYTAAPHPHQIPAYIDEPRRPSVPPNYHQSQGAGQGPAQQARPQPSPPQGHIQQLPPQVVMSPPQPSHQRLEGVNGPKPPQTLSQHAPPELPEQQAPQQAPQTQQQPPAPMNPPKSERLGDRPTQPGLDTSSIVRKVPHQSGSIFTPIDDNRSILGKHLESFHADTQAKEDPGHRSRSIDFGSRVKATSSPPIPPRASTGANFAKPRSSVAAISEAGFTPPSRSNSIKMEGGSRPRLRVQIPDEASDAGSNTGEPATSSPRTTVEASAQPVRRNGADAPRLPPPSPSATSILSAGATGPPNPFARPPPQNPLNIETPVSALPSRFLNNEFLPSPNSFYHDWNFRGDNSNTLPSPLNFATPVAGSGPTFLRDESGPAGVTNSLNGGGGAKRKSPEVSTAGPHSDGQDGLEAKRIRVDG